MDTQLFKVAPECEIVSARVFDMPCHSVFEAWANPDMLKEWWGPAGFTNTFQEFDFKVGGKWKFVMHGPGGKGNYNNECTFLKIEQPSFIAWQRQSQPIFRVVASFDETAEGKTLLTFRMQFDTAEECDKIRKFVPDKNEENFDKLEVVLGKGM